MDEASFYQENKKCFLDDFSQNQSTYNISDINNNPNSTFTIATSETALINRIIGENGFPYPNIENNDEKRDIPFIEIKDENLFMNNGLIGNYLNNINTVSESRFNICRRCFKYQNKYCCKICDRNLCQDCSINCRKKNHELIDLIQAKHGDILTARKDVTRLIDKRFNLLIQVFLKNTNTNLFLMMNYLALIIIK